MVLVVAKKSRTFFFTFPCSADEQVRRSWEGAQPGRQPKPANGNLPHHRHHAQYINGGWWGAGTSPMSAMSSLSSVSSVNSMSSAKSTRSASVAQELAAQLIIGW